MSRRTVWLAVHTLVLCAAGTSAQAQPVADYRQMLTDKSVEGLLWSRGPEAVDELLARFSPQSANVSMFELLGTTRHPRARAALLQRLRDPGVLDTQVAERVRAAAIRGLMRFPPDAEITRAIADVLPGTIARRESWLQQAALDALYLLSRPESLPALLAYSRGHPDGRDDPGLRALARIGGPEAMARVRELLRTDKEYMGWFGNLALECATLKRREILPELIAVAAKVAKRGVSDDSLIRAFGRMGDPRLRGSLEDMVSRRGFHDQFWAAVALGELGDRAALPVLRAAFPAVKEVPASPAFENRAALAFAIARLGGIEGERYLEELARDPGIRAATHAHLFLLLLRAGDPARSRAQAMAAIDRLEPYRDVERGCEGVPAESLAEALLAVRDPQVDVRLVAAMEWRGAGGVGHFLREQLDREPADRMHAALLAGLRSTDLVVINRAFERLLRLRDDPTLLLARTLKEGSLPARVFATRYLGLFARERYERELRAATADPAWQVAMEAAWMLARKPGGACFPEQPPALADTPGDAAWRGYYAMGLGHNFGTPALGYSDPLASRFVRRIRRLDDGRLLAAIMGGLAIYDGVQWRYLGQPQGLCGDEASDVLIAGPRWLVVSSAGLSVGDGQRFRCLPLEPGLLRLAAGGGRVFVGTTHGVRALEGERLVPLGGPELPVHALQVGPEGELWVATMQRENAVEPPLHRLQGKTWTSFGEPFVHFNLPAHSLEKVVEPAPVKIFDLQLDRRGRPLLATSYGVMRWDGKRFENLSLRAGARPWLAVQAALEDRRGRVWAYTGISLQKLEGDRWSSLPLVAEGQWAEILISSRGAAELLEDGDGLWIGLAQATRTELFAGLEIVEGTGFAPGVCTLLRRLDSDKARRALPPDSLIASITAGAFGLQNPDVDMRPPDRARRFMNGETLRVPANVVTISAVAKDPWDYGPVEFRFKLDEGAWTAWSDKNVLITPNILDEGVHRVQVQARDRDGHVDPTPAEVRFTVFTKELTILKIQDGQFERVFPAQYLRYQKDGLGKVLLQNLQDQPVQVDLELKVEDLFEKPAGTSLTLGPHEKKWVQVAAPFSEAVLQNPSQRVAQAVVEARFVYEGVDRSTRRAFGVQLMEANAFAWDQPARLASFIHGGDPAVARLAAEVHRALAAAHPNEVRQAHPLRNYLAALYAYEALRELGVSYKPDPARPFRGLKAGAVDSVLFPGQTLLQRGGDCDDLVVLFCSLLENLNVPTALVPVPGHIYMLLDTGVLAENRATFPVDARQTITRAGRLWLPVEVTSLGLGKPFAEAWAAGAEEHLGKYRPRPEAVVVVREAWAESPPALLAGGGDPAEAYRIELVGAAAQAGEVLGGQRAQVEKLAPVGEGREALLGRGDALVKGGLFPEALQAYTRALALQEDYPGQYGLGAAHAGQGDMLQALVCFQKALSLTQDKQQRFRCLLALAQCHKVNGSLAKARKILGEALALNPAARFDARYASLVKFVEAEDETKAAGDDESAPFFQVLLLP